MGHSVEFSPQSLDDLESAVSFIARDNPARAESFGNELIDQTDTLEEFPESGRIVPEFNDEKLRELIYEPYRIVYRINETKKEIEILRYWHSARGKPKFTNP